MKSWIELVLLAAGGAYLLILAYLYFFQRTLLFHPTHESKAQEGFYLETPIGRIRIEVRNPGRERALIYFPGNSEHWWEDPDDLSQLLPGHTIYFPHYPGYGASEGSPSQEAFYLMAEALYDRIVPRHGAIDLVGRSLGSGVALHLATRRPVRRLVLITPYDSIASLGAERYGIFPVRAIIKDPFDALADAPKIRIPVLVLLAESDSVIPHAHSRRLLRAMDHAEVKVHEIPGSDHGDIVDSPRFKTRVREFLEARATPASAPRPKDAKMRQKFINK
ncbi:alpha/beta hydrolase [Nitratifractor sp.]